MQYMRNGSLKDVLYLDPTSHSHADVDDRESLARTRKRREPSQTRREKFRWIDIVGFAVEAAAGVVHLHSKVRLMIGCLCVSMHACVRSTPKRDTSSLPVLRL